MMTFVTLVLIVFALVLGVSLVAIGFVLGRWSAERSQHKMDR